MTIFIRPARFGDIEQLVELIELRRDEYEVIAPLFWKKAKNSAQASRRYYKFLLLFRRATILVADEDGTVAGFLIAMRARVPPVFDPGPTTFVDDFYVASPDRWDDVGSALFGRLREIASDRGWSQLIVVSGTADSPKNAFLKSVGLSETSSWWTGAA